jgi:hypothetical protein
MGLDVGPTTFSPISSLIDENARISKHSNPDLENFAVSSLLFSKQVSDSNNQAKIDQKT